MNILDNIRHGCEVDDSLARNRAGVLQLVEKTRALATSDERAALLELLKIFEEDQGRASTVAAFAVIELAKSGVATTCPECVRTAENCSAHISSCAVYQAKKRAEATSPTAIAAQVLAPTLDGLTAMRSAARENGIDL